MFGIFPGKVPVNIEDELVIPTSIIINEFQEAINIPLTYWNISDYKKNWLRSLEEGLASKNHAALVVSMYEPVLTNFVFAWVIYFEGEVAYVQNNVIFLDECNDFSPERINEFVGERTTHDEDGIKISEWDTDLDSIFAFYNSLKA